MTTESKDYDRTLPAGSIIAHRLNGHYDFRGLPSQPGELRSAQILNTKSLTEEQATQIRSLLTAETSFRGEGMRCFIPGLGFTVGSGSDAMEILICLECYWAYFFQGQTKMIEILSESGRCKLAEIYVELFPGNDPTKA